MRIGFDISQTGENKAGCGFYADGLIRELVKLNADDEFILYPSFGDFYFDRRLKPDAPNGRAHVAFGPMHENRTQAQAFWRSPQASDETLGSPQIIQSNNFFAPNGLTSARLVYTVYDLNFLENYAWTTEENRHGCFKGIFEASIRADWVVGISKYTLERFFDFFPHYPRNRATVIHPASRFPLPSNSASAVADLESRAFWLIVGTIEPRKNHLTLLRAYAKLKERSKRLFPLVIVGGRGWLMDDLAHSIRDLGIGRDVRILDYVDDVTLNWLYCNAFCHVYASFYEGFGMPVLEGMNCGRPAIASNSTSMPEIVGTDGTCGFLVDPNSYEDISAAMHALVQNRDRAEAMGAAAAVRAGRFSWERSAARLRAVYEEATKRDKHFRPRAG
jgi:glycosyltransferase involved in cell wall biosynthesis